MSILENEQVFIQLRSALNHLYDPYFLRKSPLSKVFGLSDQPDTASALSRIINEAIQDLEPGKDDPNYAQRRKHYDLIMYRYVQQFSQEEVAAQLGLSVRHLRREQNTAIFYLAALLWDKYHLGSRPFSITELPAEEVPTTTPGPQADDAAANPRGGKPAEQAAPNALQLDWLKELPLEEPTNTHQVLCDVIELSQPLASRYGVELKNALGASFPSLSIHQVALRQLLLNVLSVNICIQGVGAIIISGRASAATAEIEVHSRSVTGQSRECTHDENASLEIASQLALHYKGNLTFLREPGVFTATITLPAFIPLHVLVVDDNIDFIQLVERTLSGTHYKVTGEQNPMQAIDSAEKTSPDVVILDVMMPKIDGWEILGRLRRHPLTAGIPVVVCTILPQEELALSLGARLFLRKPVRPEQILTALNQIVEGSSRI